MLVAPYVGTQACQPAHPRILVQHLEAIFEFYLIGQRLRTSKLRGAKDINVE